MYCSVTWSDNVKDVHIHIHEPVLMYVYSLYVLYITPREITFHDMQFVCLSYGDVTIIRKGLQFLAYTRQSRTLSGEGSLLGHSFLLGISVDS